MRASPEIRLKEMKSENPEIRLTNYGVTVEARDRETEVSNKPKTKTTCSASQGTEDWTMFPASPELDGGHFWKLSSS
ncbi:hypothetical protein ACLB2K_072990 [Fragaria x ananassa]